MDNYKVSIEGSNFIIMVDEEKGRFGFYTTRFVEARNCKDAEELAMELIRSELGPLILNERSNPPIIHVEEIVKVDDLADSNVSGTGFTWYMDESI